MRRALLAAVIALLPVAGCTSTPERDPAQWPIARIDLEREIPTDDPAEATYRAHCTMCHGVDGRGAGAVTGADFTSPEGPLRRPDSELVVSIRDGRRGAIGVMPAHGTILGEERIVAVLAFVRHRFGPEIVPAEMVPAEMVPAEIAPGELAPSATP